MSALLAALKKAAEEKQKKRDQPLTTSDDRELPETSEGDPLQMQFVGGEDLSNESVAEAPTRPNSEPLEFVNLNFVDEDLNDDINPKTVSEQAESTIVDSKSHQDSAPEENENNGLDLNSLELSEDPILPIGEDKPTAEPELEPEPDKIEFSGLKMAVEETPENPSKEDHGLDLETSLALNDNTDKKPQPSLTSSSPTTRLDKDAHQHQEVAQKEPDSENEEADWSLDQIPGYQQTNETQNDQAQMQRFVRAIQPKKGNLKKQFLISYWILAPLLLLGFGYYGLSVYEREYDKMTEDLKPFQQPRVPIVQSTANIEKTASPDTSTTQSTAAQTASEKADVVDKSIEGESKGAVETKLTKEKDTSTQVALPKPAKKQRMATTQNTSPKASSSAKPVQAESTEDQDSSFKIEAVAPKKSVFLGYEAYQKGDYATADDHYQQAYLDDPDRLPVLFGLAATAVKKGETQKALTLYQQILKKHPSNQDAIVAEAVLGATLSEGPAVRNKLETLIVQMPTNAKLQSALGHQYARKQNWVMAQKYYYKAFELEQHNHAYARNLAVTLDRLGEYALAKQYYEKALLDANPTSPQTIQMKNRLLAINQHLLQRSAQ